MGERGNRLLRSATIVLLTFYELTIGSASSNIRLSDDDIRGTYPREPYALYFEHARHWTIRHTFRLIPVDRHIGLAGTFMNHDRRRVPPPTARVLRIFATVFIGAFVPNVTRTNDGPLPTKKNKKPRRWRWAGADNGGCKKKMEK